MAKRLESCQTAAEADAWQAAHAKPLYAEIASLDKQIASVTRRKRAIRDELLALEQQAAARRAELATGAGPAQQLGR